MKRLGEVEIGALLLGIVLVAFGLYMTIHPTEMRVPHPANDRYHFLRQGMPVEHVSKEKARIYGIISVVFGIGIGWLVFYRPRK